MTVLKGSLITVESFINAFNSLVIDKINNQFNYGVTQNRGLSRGKIPFVNIKTDAAGNQIGVWLNGQVGGTRPPEFNVGHIPIKDSFKSNQGNDIVQSTLTAETDRKYLKKNYNRFSVDGSGNEVQHPVSEIVPTNISKGQIITYADVEMLLRQISTELSFLRTVDLNLIYKNSGGDQHTPYTLVAILGDGYGSNAMMDGVPSEKNKPITAAAMNKILNDLYNRLDSRLHNEKVTGLNIEFCHSNCHSNCHSSGRGRR